MSDTKPDPPFIVLRAQSGVPFGGHPGYEGRWLVRAELEQNPDPYWASTMRTMQAFPTRRYEIREDGAVAQVYEIGFGKAQPFAPQPAEVSP